MAIDKSRIANAKVATQNYILNELKNGIHTEDFEKQLEDLMVDAANENRSSIEVTMAATAENADGFAIGTLVIYIDNYRPFAFVKSFGSEHFQYVFGEKGFGELANELEAVLTDNQLLYKQTEFIADGPDEKQMGMLAECCYQFHSRITFAIKIED